MTFHDLHQQKKPLLIANVWDIASIKVAEKLNFQAIATSSAAIATTLGYEDGEQMCFSELTHIVKKMLANTTLPLSVDLKSGYSRCPKKIILNIKKLASLGVVGINIEDSIVVNSARTLLDANEFTNTLKKIKIQLLQEQTDIFINVRTDTFLLLQQDKIQQTQKRIALYQDTGIDGIFIPCIETEYDIRTVIKAANIPINVMCMPNLVDFERLAELGVKRISMGNFLFEKMYSQYHFLLKNILEQQSFNSAF